MSGIYTTRPVKYLRHLRDVSSVQAAQDELLVYKDGKWQPEQGPVGPQGPQGPQGPAGSSPVVFYTPPASIKHRLDLALSPPVNTLDEPWSEYSKVKNLRIVNKNTALTYPYVNYLTGGAGFHQALLGGAAQYRAQLKNLYIVPHDVRGGLLNTVRMFASPLNFGLQAPATSAGYDLQSHVHFPVPASETVRIQQIATTNFMKRSVHLGGSLGLHIVDNPGMGTVSSTRNYEFPTILQYSRDWHLMDQQDTPVRQDDTWCRAWSMYARLSWDAVYLLLSKDGVVWDRAHTGIPPQTPLRSTTYLFGNGIGGIIQISSTEFISFVQESPYSLAQHKTHEGNVENPVSSGYSVLLKESLDLKYSTNGLDFATTIQDPDFRFGPYCRIVDPDASMNVRFYYFNKYYQAIVYESARDSRALHLVGIPLLSSSNHDLVVYSAFEQFRQSMWEWNPSATPAGTDNNAFLALRHKNSGELPDLLIRQIVGPNVGVSPNPWRYTLNHPDEPTEHIFNFLQYPSGINKYNFAQLGCFGTTPDVRLYTPIIATATHSSGGSPYHLTSLNRGIDWVTNNLPFDFSYGIAHNQNVFVCVGYPNTSNKVLISYSADAVHWYPALISEQSTSFSIQSERYSDVYWEMEYRRFVAFSQTKLAFSTNGIHWETQPMINRPGDTTPPPYSIRVKGWNEYIRYGNAYYNRNGMGDAVLRLKIDGNRVATFVTTSTTLQNQVNWEYPQWWATSLGICAGRGIPGAPASSEAAIYNTYYVEPYIGTIRATQADPDALIQSSDWSFTFGSASPTGGVLPFSNVSTGLGGLVASLIGYSTSANLTFSTCYSDDGVNWVAKAVTKNNEKNFVEHAGDGEYVTTSYSSSATSGGLYRSKGTVSRSVALSSVGWNNVTGTDTLGDPGDNVYSGVFEDFQSSPTLDSTHIQYPLPPGYAVEGIFTCQNRSCGAPPLAIAKDKSIANTADGGVSSVIDTELKTPKVGSLKTLQVGPLSQDLEVVCELTPANPVSALQQIDIQVPSLPVASNYVPLVEEFLELIIT